MRYRTSRLHRRREAPPDCACRHSSGTPPSRSSSACTDTEGGLLMDTLPGWCQEAQKRADPHRLHPCAVGRQSPCGQPRSSGAPQGCTGGKAGRQARVTAGVQHMVSNSMTEVLPHIAAITGRLARQHAGAPRMGAPGWQAPAVNRVFVSWLWRAAGIAMYVCALCTQLKEGSPGFRCNCRLHCCARGQSTTAQPGCRPHLRP
jgi:hypothetical protein